jgi:hypothetical protein
MATLERRIACLESSHANPRSVYQYSDSELEAIVQRSFPGVELTDELLLACAKQTSATGEYHEKS